MDILLRGLAAPLVAFLCVASSPAWAQVPQPPEIAARSFVLVDVTARQDLASRDADSPVEPGSLTKLMTAYVVFDALRGGRIDLAKKLVVSARAAAMPGPRMVLEPGMQVPVEDLVKGLIVQSGNDAAMALAEGVGGTPEHFVEMMNAQAAAMGLKATAFRNPDGQAQAGHVSTARELSVIASQLVRDFPRYAGYYAIRKYRYQGTPTANDTNRNLLLFRDPSVDGLKTSHTESGGYGIVATARRDFPNVGSRRLVAVVLGASSENARANEAQKLLNWGYTAWEGVKLFDGGQAVVSPAVWQGAERTARLGRFEAVVVAVPAGTAGGLRTQVARPDPLIAPLSKGQQVGMLKVTAGERPVADLPLFALDGVEQAGLVRRAWDALRLWVK